VAAIAERAGVQRHTVYAHFPDTPSLFSACSAHWRALHPFPEVEELTGIDDPAERLRRGLDALYTWYERVEPDLALFDRDVEAVPAEVQAGRAAQLGRLRAALERGWPGRRPVRAAIGHAVEFETWRSLCRRQGLSRRSAVAAMVALAESR
jgi:AcrR family transcriptional regulator